jgi:hypothetical protein
VSAVRDSLTLSFAYCYSQRDAGHKVNGDEGGREYVLIILIRYVVDYTTDESQVPSI